MVAELFGKLLTELIVRLSFQPFKLLQLIADSQLQLHLPGQRVLYTNGGVDEKTTVHLALRSKGIPHAQLGIRVNRRVFPS